MGVVVTVLGAGYMGSAITFPLAENGADVRLWGTWLDDELIDGCKRGAHPKLGQPLHPGVRLFSSTQLEQALAGSDYVVMATSSDGFIPVLERALQFLSEKQPVITLTKGFAVSDTQVETLSDAAGRMAKEIAGIDALTYAAVGGPVKAVELAGHIPSGTVFAGGGTKVDALARLVSTDYYLVERSEDVRGLELAVALKNVYAMALGICDGLYAESKGTLYHNLPALLFAVAVEEMAHIVEHAGGKARTVTGLAGVGDLHVTARSGKNQEFGALVGAGASPGDAYRSMMAEGKQAEGYLALRASMSWIENMLPALEGKLPLLTALDGIMYNGEEIGDSFRRLLSQLR